MADIDTGVATAPAIRPSASTPAAYVSGTALNRPLDTIDSGTATNPAPIINTFDDTSLPATPDPGY